MQLKRFISLLCVAVLILTAAIVPVSAAETESLVVGVEVGADTPISTNPWIIKAGDKVSVRINATNNPGISLLDMVLTYNADALELESCSDNMLFGQVTNLFSRNGYLRYLLITSSSDVIVDAEGTLFEATFISKVDFDGSAEFLVKLYGDNEANCSTGFGNYVPFIGDEVVVEYHDITEAGVVTDPDCLNGGYTTYTCDNHVVVGNLVDALGHNYAKTVVDPTCLDGGYTINTCTRCEDTYNDAYVPANGHTLVNIDAQAPTCTEIGWEAYEVCDVCDYTTYVEIAATGHDLVDHDAQAATCTEIGWEAYQTCNNCDYTTYVEIPVAEHTVVAYEAKAPTCTEIGWEAYEACANCDYTTYVEIPALGHIYVDHDAHEPNCTEIGWDAYQTCERCDYSSYVEKSPLGHTPVLHSGKAATCTEDGWNPYETCVKCDYTSYEVIKATGHDIVEHEARPVSCNDKGWDAYETCNNCSYTTFKEILPVGHNMVSYEGQAPTCYAEGWYAYEACSKCDYSTYTAIPMLKHTLINHKGQDATCTEAGWTSYDTCMFCDYSSKEVIPAKGHAIVEHDAQAATCTEIGWDAYQTCEVCDYTTYVEIPATGHVEGNPEVGQIIDATCTETGSYEDVTYCTVCREILNVNVIETPALGHTEGSSEIENVVDATCTETGSYEDVTYCTVCREILNVNVIETPALGHTEGSSEIENVVDATCTEGGSYDEVVYCTVCNDIVNTTKIDTPPSGHAYVDHEAQAPTCTEIGWEAYQTCEKCDYTSYVEVAATGHTPADKWELVKEATYEEEGEKVRYCTVCSEVAESAALAVVVKIPFTDVSENAWYYKSVEYCYNKGYISGLNETTFAPSNNITREQFVMILSKVAGADLTEYADKELPFTDVKDGAWYEAAIAWAYENGYSSGVSADRFGVGNQITREQVARFLYVFAEKNGIDVSGRADLSSFVDADTISEWAVDCIAWAVDCGIISGMTETTIAPRGNATRAQAARMFMVFDTVRNVF